MRMSGWNLRNLPILNLNNRRVLSQTIKSNYQPRTHPMPPAGLEYRRKKQKTPQSLGLTPAQIYEPCCLLGGLQVVSIVPLCSCDVIF